MGAVLGLSSCSTTTKAFAVFAVSMEMSLLPATSAHIVVSIHPTPYFLMLWVRLPSSLVGLELLGIWPGSC